MGGGGAVAVRSTLYKVPMHYERRDCTGCKVDGERVRERVRARECGLAGRGEGASEKHGGDGGGSSREHPGMES